MNFPKDEMGGKVNPGAFCLCNEIRATSMNATILTETLKTQVIITGHVFYKKKIVYVFFGISLRDRPTCAPLRFKSLEETLKVVFPVSLFPDTVYPSKKLP